VFVRAVGGHRVNDTGSGQRLGCVSSGSAAIIGACIEVHRHVCRQAQLLSPCPCPCPVREEADEERRSFAAGGLHSKARVTSRTGDRTRRRSAEIRSPMTDSEVRWRSRNRNRSSASAGGMVRHARSASSARHARPGLRASEMKRLILDTLASGSRLRRRLASSPCRISKHRHRTPP
jgi:hypothetical protein